LPDDIRIELAYDLERVALRELDVSYLDDDDILGLFQPMRLLSLGQQLVGTLNSVLSNRITEIAELADPEQDVPDQFDQVRSFVSQLRESFWDDDRLQPTLRSLDDEIDVAIAEVSKKKTREEDLDSWPDVSPPKVAAAPRGRSMFSDVDE